MTGPVQEWQEHSLTILESVYAVPALPSVQ
jgi:hypothetical protein